LTGRNWRHRFLSTAGGQLLKVNHSSVAFPQAHI
jgi:hypothetical protein